MTSGAAGPRQARTLLYQRSLAIPVESMLIGNLRADIEPIAERFATAIGSAPLLLGDLRRLSPEQIAWYRAKIDWFKGLRREIPIHESFFPLGAWMHPNAAQWDGYARLSHAGEGIVVLFRNASRDSEVSVSIPMFGTDRCSLRSEMTGTHLGTVSAEDLRTGVTLALVDDVEISSNPGLKSRGCDADHATDTDSRRRARVPNPSAPTYRSAATSSSSR